MLDAKPIEENSKRFFIFQKERARLFGIFILLFLLLGALWIYTPWTSHRHPLKTPFFFPLHIEGFSEAKIPYCTVQIENQTIFAKIDLGYESTLSLPSSFLSQIKHKKPLSSSAQYGIQGKPYPIQTYKGQKVSIGHLNFFPSVIGEYNEKLEEQMILNNQDTRTPEIMGRIGWQLFRENNLLVDCKNNQLALFDDIEILKNKGYSIENFTMTPFTLHDGFIAFKVNADMGPIECILDTGSTWNLYNQKAEQFYFDAKDMFDTSTFQINGKDFGPMTFTRIFSPTSLQAILGMEFFQDTIVVIDFQEQKLYFYEYPDEAENTEKILREFAKFSY